MSQLDEIISDLIGLPFLIFLDKNLKEYILVVESVFKSLEEISGVVIPREYSLIHVADYKVDPDDLLSRLSAYLTENNHQYYPIVITDRDLQPSGTNFVFGTTHPKLTNDFRMYSPWRGDGNPYVPGVVVSTHRLKTNGTDDPTQLYLMLLHELGHFFGVPPKYEPLTGRPNENYIDETHGLEDHHCNLDSCIMSQVNVPGRKTPEQKARYYDSRSGERLFCPSCETALRANIRTMYGDTVYDDMLRHLYVLIGTYWQVIDEHPDIRESLIRSFYLTAEAAFPRLT